MQRNMTTLAMILGFLLFMFGFIAIILYLVGLQLSFLVFIDRWGGTAGLVIRILMVIFGLAILYIARSKFEN